MSPLEDHDGHHCREAGHRVEVVRAEVRRGEARLRTLHRDMKAQQDKADAQRDVAKKEAEAEAARGAASAAETREEAHRRA